MAEILQYNYINTFKTSSFLLNLRSLNGFIDYTLHNYAKINNWELLEFSNNTFTYYVLLNRKLKKYLTITYYQFHILDFQTLISRINFDKLTEVLKANTTLTTDELNIEVQRINNDSVIINSKGIWIKFNKIKIANIDLYDFNRMELDFTDLNNHINQMIVANPIVIN